MIKATTEFDILNVYPIGSIYMSVNNSNPSTLFGGTWERWAKGQVAVGVSDSGTFSAPELSGGTEQQSYTLSDNAIARIAPSTAGGIYSEFKTSSWNASRRYTATGQATDTTTTQNVTGGTAVTGTTTNGNNLQPYITCYMWKRTA